MTKKVLTLICALAMIPVHAEDILLLPLEGHEPRRGSENTETVLRATPLNFDGWSIQRNASRGRFTGQSYQSNRATSVFAILGENNALTTSGGRVIDPLKAAELSQLPERVYPRSRADKIEIPSSSPFSNSWTYEKNIRIPGDFVPGEDRLWVDLSNMNYRAWVDVNGNRVQEEPFVGPYRKHRLDITDHVKGLKAGDPVPLKVRVEPADLGSLSYSWIDWHVTPPDRMMGVLEEPFVEKTGAVRVSNPFVKTDYDPASHTAKLHVEFHVDNPGDETLENVLIKIKIHGKEITARIPRLLPNSRNGGSTKIVLSPESFEALKIENPRLWWPIGMGDVQPELGVGHREELSIEIFEDGKSEASHSMQKMIGLRDAQGYLDANDVRRFRVNGREFTVRGAGWSGDYAYSEGLDKKKQKLDLLANAGYNSIRQEGSIEDNEFYEHADQMGMMVLAGLACCGQWEADESGRFPWMKNPDPSGKTRWNESKYKVAEDSVRDIMLKLRQHPSFLAWFNGSDFAPNPTLEARYARVYEDTLMDPGFEQIISRASKGNYTRESRHFGKSGSKMQGPYERVSPRYWYDYYQAGAADGFHSELGPGVSIAHADSLREMSEKSLDPDDLFTDCYSALLKNEDLKKHSGTPAFGELRHFYRALCAQYGEPQSFQDFVDLAQIMNYQDHRAMNEAFGQHKRARASGHIHWMGMNAYPSLRWNLFDYHLRQGGAYYGAQKGNNPLHLSYNYDEGSVHLLNHESKALPPGFTAEVELLDSRSQPLFSEELGLGAVREDSSTTISLQNEAAWKGALARGGVKFLNLVLKNPQGEVVDRNFYWLPSSQAKIDRSTKTWFRTAESSYSNYNALSGVESSPAQFKVIGREPGSGRVLVELSNPGAKVSLFNKLDLKDANGQSIWPQKWSENMISLMPGEKQVVSIELASDQLNSQISMRSLHVRDTRPIDRERLRRMEALDRNTDSDADLVRSPSIVGGDYRQESVARPQPAARPVGVPQGTPRPAPVASPVEQGAGPQPEKKRKRWRLFGN